MQPLENLFDQFKQDLLNLDPVNFCEKNLTLDGAPFRLHGNGYKPFADIYRNVGMVALKKDAKPIIIVKGRQVGATTMAAALSLYFMASGLFGNNGRPPVRLMHCFPTLLHTYSYAKTKLNPMIVSAIKSKGEVKPGSKTKSVVETKIDKTQGANDSLQFKQFINGNFLRIESTGLTGNRLAGGTNDILFYDEVQDIRSEAIANVNKTVAQAKYGQIGDGVQVFFGTPRQKGSDFWHRWNKSSQQYYHLGCEKCEQHFPLYTPGSNEWESIWLHGFTVKCPHCGCEQDKRDAAERGQWIALNDDPDCKLVGYHLNQLYMPHFTKEKILAEKPEVNIFNSERAYQNEVLGEFYSGDAAPLTEEEVYDYCADLQRRMVPGILTSRKLKVYAGFDWGKKADVEQIGKDGELKKTGQSYSAAVIITADGPQLLSIQFATLLKRNDLEEKKDIVEQMFRRYSITQAAGDIGYANDLTEILQRQYGDQFLATESKDNIKGRVKFVDDEFPKTIRFERDYFIAEVFDLMKKGGIRFPYGDYEKIAWLVKHCCSMEIKTTMNRFGDPVSRYIKGGSPNDGFAALVNAYLAYKFDITNAFKLQNPNTFKDPTQPAKFPISLGYIKRRV